MNFQEHVSYLNDFLLPEKDIIENMVKMVKAIMWMKLAWPVTTHKWPL